MTDNRQDEQIKNNLNNDNNNEDNDSRDDLEDEEENQLDEIVFDQDGENIPISKDNIEDYREKVKKSGVIYISYIPEGMTVKLLREKLEPYGVTRIYLAPRNKDSSESKKKKQNFKEGWAEFTNKLMGKLAEFEMNGKPIGGKRNLPFREELWTIKYLHKFKWHHLIEKMNYNKKLREQRLNAEIAQAKRETNFIEKKYEQSSIFNRKRKRDEKLVNNEEIIEESQNIKNDDDKSDTRFNMDKFKRNFKQRKPVLK